MDSHIIAKNGNQSLALDPTDINANATYSFPIRSVFRLSTSTSVDFDCTGTSDYYFVGDTAPAFASSTWIPCPTGVFPLNIPSLQSGVNQFKVWTKSAAGVCISPTIADPVKTSAHHFSLPLSELGANNTAGYNIVELTSALWIIVDPNNDLNGANAGAVHLTTNSGKIIKTIRGYNAGDKFGDSIINSSAIVKLQGSRFAVVAPQAKTADGSKALAGQIRIFDYTGEQLFLLEGDDANDNFGKCNSGENGFLELSNGNWIICSSVDVVGGLAAAGSIKLYNGNTGALITSLNGDVTNDKMGYGTFDSTVRQLASGLVVIPSPGDSIVAGAAAVGSVIFMNPTTGAIVSEIRGQTAGDTLGTNGIHFLTNGNLVIRSRFYTIGATPNLGRYTFVSGTTGLVLLNVDGFGSEGYLGYEEPVELANGNVVLFTGLWGWNGVVTLVNSNNDTVLSTITGAGFNYRLSSSGVISLSNGNFVILSQNDEPTGLSGQGSAKLVNGNNGAVIATLGGDLFGGFGMEGIALNNGNYVVLMENYGASNEGRMTIHDGTTGAILGQLLGAADGDLATAIGNVRFNQFNRFAVSFSSMDVGAIANAGCYYIFNSTNGAQVTSRCGDDPGENVGGNAYVLDNGNFVITSTAEIVGGIAKGQVDILDGTTAATVASFNGDIANDFQTVYFAKTNTANFALGFTNFDAGGTLNAGRVLIIDGTTGAIVNTFNGQSPSDQIGIVSTTSQGHFVLQANQYDYNGLTNAGMVKMIDRTSGQLLVEAYGQSASDALYSVFNLTNGDYLIPVPAADSHGITNSGGYIIIPMD